MCHSVCPNRSAPLVANSRESSSWCSPRMFTANLRAFSILGQVVEVRATQNSTSGGSSDTDVNEFAATPAGSPSESAVMMVTPVANWPSVRRNASWSGRRTSSGVACASSVTSPARSRFVGEVEHQTLVGGDDLRPVDACRQILRVREDVVDVVVGVRGAVVEEDEPLRAGFTCHVHCVVDGRVPEVTLGLVLGDRV